MGDYIRSLVYWFLIIELLVRWAIAIINKHHKRWFFFPFIHWYEILAIIPQLRFYVYSALGLLLTVYMSWAIQLFRKAGGKLGYFIIAS